jgi:general secretion pathway protein E
MADSDQIDLELQPEELPHTGTLAVGELERLAAVLGLPFQSSISNVNPPRNPPHGEFSRLIGSWGKQSHVVPVGEQDGVLVVATSDPLNTQALDAVRYCYNLPLHVVVTSETEVVRAMNSVRTTLMSDRSSALEAGEKDRGDDILQTLKIDVTDAEDDDAPIIRYVNTLIFRAASQRASDIHIEPFEDCLKVRFRIDGVLQDVDTEETAFQAAILSRIKVMANLDIAEKRLPQDGRIGIRIAGQDVDIRVSTVPTRYGERIVMRLLDKSKVLIDLGSLGLSKRNLGAVERTIVKSHGIVLVTGPTGSGKTTSLYAFLSTINAPDKNILTVEDPVEYELKGIGQMQVNPKINFTFSTGLRSILRQDPDVIMIGEIRDLETVEIAIQASLTGHLVFSTLHTNDAPGALTRMLDMGVEPFLISSSLLCVMAQRLVRTLCPSCRVPHQLTQIEARELGLDYATASRSPVFKARDGGCEFCQRTGYRGRMGIHEMLMIDDDIRSKIMARADSTTIRAASREMRSLRWDGAEKVLAGLTSVEEVLRVTQEDLIDVG